MANITPRVSRLPDCERILGLHTPGGPEVLIQWKALRATTPGQPTSASAEIYELGMTRGEAFRLLELLAQFWKMSGEPPFPKR